MSVTLQPLPYPLQALEPFLSRRTLAGHHDRHEAAYIARCQTLIEKTYLEDATLEVLVLESAAQDGQALFNAAAQAWNHAFYWRCMRPGGGGDADGAIAWLIKQHFGSQSSFRHQFMTIAGDQFGSGWVWLVFDDGRLKISATSNADTPLVRSQTPLLVIDVWEHAYYLDYQHRRLDYIAAFLGHLVNWDFVNQNLVQALNHPITRAGARVANPASEPATLR